MAKNRTQLEKEAIELEIDFSDFETNAEFSEAIEAAKADAIAAASADSEDEEPKEGKRKNKKAEEFTLETTKSVSFTINGKKQEGVKFSFESAEVFEARKQMLIERYGAGVIKE